MDIKPPTVDSSNTFVYTMLAEKSGEAAFASAGNPSQRLARGKRARMGVLGLRNRHSELSAVLIVSQPPSGADRFAEDFEQLFAQVRGFNWNPKKRATNLRDHEIDFEDVKGIFDGYTFVRRSDRHGEIRYQVFGMSTAAKSRSPSRSVERSAGSSRRGGHAETKGENITRVWRAIPGGGRLIGPRSMR